MKEYTPTKYSVHEILRKTNQGLLSIHHALQRTSGLWSNEDKSNYISDILQGLPMPELVLAEELSYGRKIIWILDGVQRTSNVLDFMDNRFSISKKVERYMIEYVVPVLDEDGMQKLDEEGKPIGEIRYFDIRGKKFKQLPQEIQDDFLYYKFDAVMYHDCSKENISYHLKRYNAGKPMNAEQKGFTFIGDRFGNVVKNIAALSFFEDAIGKYSSSDFKNGRVNRVIAESLMTTRFLDKWSKDFATNCKYIEANATVEDFNELSKLIEDIEEFIIPEVGKMFDSKNSFLWFGLYSKFVKMGIEKSRFNDFMLKLNKGMYTEDENGKIIKGAPMTGICTIEIDGFTFEDLLKNTATKDVNVVKSRIDFLTKLMCEYFNINYNDKFGKKQEIINFYDDFKAINLPHSNKRNALCSLIYFTEYPVNNYFPDNLISFERWLEEKGNCKNAMDDCLLWAEVLKEKIPPDACDKFSENDIPILIQIISEMDDVYEDEQLCDWLSEIKNETSIEQTGESAAITDKRSYFIESLYNFTNKRKDEF